MLFCNCDTHKVGGERNGPHFLRFFGSKWTRREQLTKSWLDSRLSLRDVSASDGVSPIIVGGCPETPRGSRGAPEAQSSDVISVYRSKSMGQECNFGLFHSCWTSSPFQTLFDVFLQFRPIRKMRGQVFKGWQFFPQIRISLSDALHVVSHCVFTQALSEAHHPFRPVIGLPGLVAKRRTLTLPPRPL